MFKEEDAFLIADNDVRIFFVSDISGDNLGADAGVVVDEMRDEVSLAFGRANESEPIENCGIIGFGIGAVRPMRPKAFAGDDVFKAVTVHINQVQRVELSKGDAITIGCGTFIQNGVLAETDLAILLDLFVPRKAVAVSVNARDDVVEAIAVDIIDIHLRAATGERIRVFDPDGIAGERERLFPPAVFFNDVHASITIDVADA